MRTMTHCIDIPLHASIISRRLAIGNCNKGNQSSRVASKVSNTTKSPEIANLRRHSRLTGAFYEPWRRIGREISVSLCWAPQCCAATGYDVGGPRRAVDGGGGGGCMGRCAINRRIMGFHPDRALHAASAKTKSGVALVARLPDTRPTTVAACRTLSIASANNLSVLHA